MRYVSTFSYSLRPGTSQEVHQEQPPTSPSQRPPDALPNTSANLHVDADDPPPARASRSFGDGGDADDPPPARASCSFGDGGDADDPPPARASCSFGDRGDIVPEFDSGAPGGSLSEGEGGTTDTADDAGSCVHDMSEDDDDISVHLPTEPVPAASVGEQHPMQRSSSLVDQCPVSDIGEVVGKSSQLTDEERTRLLKPWEAPEGFSWPYSERSAGHAVRKNYLRPQHFRDKYASFAYSSSKKGIFGKTCVLFGVLDAGGVQLNRLVRTPLQKFSHLIGRDGYLTTHLQREFHLDSAYRARVFQQQVATGSDVADMQDKAAEKERSKNRESLKRLLKGVEHLGRLGLPLRGHRDSGKLSADDISYTEGNFRATLQLMAECGDTVLKEHLKSAKKNATYISPASQNDLIESVEITMREAVVEELKSARYFTLLADETTDVSGKEQLSVCLRYVLPDTTLRERLLHYEEATDLTGAGLSAQILKILRNNGINTDNMVGQGYDGASAMAGEKNGVQRFVQDECPAASYSHCASHALNLCLVKAAQVREIQAARTTIHETAKFLSESNKRLAILQSCIAEKCPESSRTRLKKNLRDSMGRKSGGD